MAGGQETKAEGGGEAAAQKTLDFPSEKVAAGPWAPAPHGQLGPHQAKPAATSSNPESQPLTLTLTLNYVELGGPEY